MSHGRDVIVIIQLRGSWCDTKACHTGLLIPLKNKDEVKMSIWQALASHQDPLNDDYDLTAFFHFTNYSASMLETSQ